MKKYLCVICLLLVGCFLFCGCAEVSYSITMDSTGRIEQKFEVDLDKTAIENAGYTLIEVKQKVYNKINSVVVNQNDFIRAYAIFTSTTPTECGIECKIKIIDEDSICAYISFKDSNVYKNFNKFVSGFGGSSDESEDNDTKTQIVKGLFYNKIITYNKTVYYDLQNNSFAQEMLALFDGSQAGTTAFTLSDVKYNFYYALPTDKIYSDANDTISYKGLTIHHWQFDLENANQDIATYQIIINPVAWYLLAIVLTLLVLLILIVVIIFKKNTKKVANPIANEQN